MTIYEMNAAELRRIARQQNMPGAWSANKSQMIEFLESISYSHELQIEPELTEEPELNSLPSEEEVAPEVKSEATENTLKSYGAWVVNRETKELTTVVGEADSREEFYQSIKDKYRVRLITKPEKLDEECKQWEIKHARNKVLKNEKYAADKAEALKMKMSVAEYRKWVREHE